ncbi:MAG: hypothetical protein NTW28_32850 [Candidatus Solibacter sp.]|nr:hypothetical protein [Candidatus Solibacter sp.]
MLIEGAESTGNLQLHGVHTPHGTLLLAALPLGLAHVEAESLTQQGEDTAKALWPTVHDLRNPISSIIGSCEYLSEYSPENLEPEQREMLSAIETSARTLLGLSAKLYEICGGGRSRK